MFFAECSVCCCECCKLAAAGWCVAAFLAGCLATLLACEFFMVRSNKP